ncbi:MAG: hypothetical protein WCV85_01580 [Patescibacteria group bacterium]
MLITFALLATLASAPTPTATVGLTDGYTQASVDSLRVMLDAAMDAQMQRLKTAGRFRTYDTKASGGVTVIQFEQDLKTHLPVGLAIRSTWRVTVGTCTHNGTKSDVLPEEQSAPQQEKWLKICFVNPKDPGHLPNVSVAVQLANGKPVGDRKYEFYPPELAALLSARTEEEPAPADSNSEQTEN